MPWFRSLRLRGFEQLLHLLDRVAARRGARAPAPHLAVGRTGELAAYFYLRRLGYEVVARRWRSGRAPGDLDLVAWEGDTLCFVEVKARTARDFAPAESAVDRDKQITLRRLARHYLRQMPAREILSRFDIVSVYLEPGREAALEIRRDAFGWR